MVLTPKKAPINEKIAIFLIKVQFIFPEVANLALLATVAIHADTLLVPNAT